MTRNHTQTGATGATGEFHVAAQLSHRGWATSLLLGNSPRTDILAQHAETQRQIGVQSKAANNGGSFQVGQKSEAASEPDSNEWFVLVGLKEPGVRPDFYVVPRNVISVFAYCGHAHWLKTPGKNGRVRNQNSMRSLNQADFAPYLERWDDLLSSPGEVPCWFRGPFWDWVDSVGLPPGHPGIVPPSEHFLQTGQVT